MINAQLELLLYRLSWILSPPLRPTLRRVARSFEDWAYWNGILDRVRLLETRQLLELYGQERSLERVCRLTDRGFLLVWGGQDAMERWSRPWDGIWRLVLFDIAEKQAALRNTLRRHLRQARLGCLQWSVWLSPDPVSELVQGLRRVQVDPATLIFLEGQPAGGERPLDLVQKAWNFREIDEHYRVWEAEAAQAPRTRPRLPEEWRFLDLWSRREWRLWKECVRRDPLLPQVLCPPHYRGRQYWEHRQDLVQRLGKCLCDNPD